LTLTALLESLSSPVWAFQDNTHRAITEAAVRSKYSRIEESLAKELGVGKGLEQVAASQGGDSRTLLDWLKFGSVEEDTNLLLRYLNHFYDPYRHIGLWDHYVTTGDPALHWAWNNQGRVANGDFSWAKAKESYLKYIEGKTSEERASACALLFRSLGQVAHLLEDMASPPHTRNDAHLSSRFETYCNQTFTTEAVVTGLGPEPPPTFGVKQEIDGICSDFAAFWDTGQLAANAGSARSSAALFPSTPGLAEFSNAYFVTDDTMFTGEPDQQVVVAGPKRHIYAIRSVNADSWHRFPWPKLRELQGWDQVLPDQDIFTPSSFFDSVFYSDYFVQLIRAGETDVIDSPDLPPIPVEQWFATGIDCSRVAPNVPRFCSVRYRYKPGAIYRNHQLWVGLRDRNHDAQARVLIPKATGYVTGLLNYFFRGKLAVNVIPSATSEGSELRITNLSDEALGEGEFQLLCDHAITGTRDTVAVIDQGSGYPGNLDPNQSFTAQIGCPELGGPLWLVFKGTLGEEKTDAVAAKSVCDTPEPKDDTGRYQVTDLGTFTGIPGNDLANWGLNNHGAVMGFHNAFTCSEDSLTGGGGMVWAPPEPATGFPNGVFHAVGEGIEGWGTRVMDINDQGIVAGTVFDEEGRSSLARWNPGSGGEYGSPETVTNRALGGITVNNQGWVLDPLGSTLWGPGETVIDLKSAFTNAAPGHTLEMALDLNDRGELLVQASQPGEPVTFYLWSLGQAPSSLGVRCSAIGLLNNEGQAALATFKKRVVSGFEYDLPNLIVLDHHTGQQFDLDIMLSNLDLCDCGIVVGTHTQGSTTYPKIWDRIRGLRDLATLAKIPAGMVLTHALRVNNSGKILALGKAGGVTHAVLLQTADEKPAVNKLASGL
jgi:hypothetical protein